MCQSQGINPYDHDSEGRTISRCAACRLLFMNPQYSDEHLAAYYAGYMFKDPDFSEAEMANRKATDNLPDPGWLRPRGFLAHNSKVVIDLWRPIA